MELIITLCAALSAGTVFGVVAGAAKYRLHRKRSYSDKQVAAYQRLWKKGSILLRFATGTVLALGLIWCTGFLVVGALYPDQTDYANNMAELIVCVLTVVSSEKPPRADSARGGFSLLARSGSRRAAGT